MGPKVKGCVNQLELFTFEQKPRGGRLGFILSYERFETGIRALAKKNKQKKARGNAASAVSSDYALDIPTASLKASYLSDKPLSVV